MSILISLALTAFFVYFIYLYNNYNKVLSQRDSLLRADHTPKFHPIIRGDRTIHVCLDTLKSMAQKAVDQEQLYTEIAELRNESEKLTKELVFMRRDKEHIEHNFDVFINATHELRYKTDYNQGFEDGLIIGLGKDA